MKKLLIIALLLSTTSMAIEDDKLKHVAVSYALQTAMYGMSKNGLRMETVDAIVFSAATVFIFSTAFKAATGGLRTKDGVEDIGANVFGQVLSIGTIVTFDF